MSGAWCDTVSVITSLSVSSPSVVVNVTLYVPITISVHSNLPVVGFIVALPGSPATVAA